MKLENTNQNIKSWADLCRVFSIFGVIVIHACGAKLYSFGKIAESEWLQVNFVDSLVRCSVPLFVMLSGALILSKDEKLISPLNIFKRISKVGIPLFVWNILYLLYVAHYTGQEIDWLSMLRQPPMYHLWFVYMIVGLYLLLPVLQAVYNAIMLKFGVGLYLLFIWVVVTSVPIYQPLPLLNLFQQTSLLGYAGYFLLGAVIASTLEKRRSIAVWAIIYLIAVIVTFKLTWDFSEHENTLIEKAYLYFSPNVIVSSLASFFIFTEIKINSVSSKVLHWISNRSFLVFFMHVVILEQVQNYIFSLKLTIPTSIEILLIAMLTFAISLAIASIIRIFPKSNVLLG